MSKTPDNERKKDALIAKQQLEIEGLKETAKEMEEDFRFIWSSLYCCGAPLNDNLLGFSREQMEPLFKIGKTASYWLEDRED